LDLAIEFDDAALISAVEAAGGLAAGVDAAKMAEKLLDKRAAEPGKSDDGIRKAM
jgi:hypothetical protein